MADFNKDYTRILIFCQNKMNFTTLKQMTNDVRLNQWKPKISWKPTKNLGSVCTKIFFIPLSTKLFRVICRSCNYFYHLPSHQYLLFCLFASVSRWKNHCFKVQVHERKGHLKLPCSLTR